MDGVALSRAALLRSHLAGLKDDGRGLTPSSCADVVTSLCSQTLLLESQLHGASAAARGQVTEAAEQWYAALGKLISKTSLGPERCVLVAPLLGATVASCESARLLLNYNTWGGHLVDALKRHRDTATQQQQQGGGQPHLDAAAALCAAISKLFSRLQDFVDVPGSGVRREGSALASRAAGIVLPFLSDSSNASCQVAALQLVQVLLSALPTALRNHAPALEAALASTISTGSASGAAKALAGRCLGSLAATAGDAPTYSTAFRRLLISAHDVLDELLMGLEEAQPSPAYFKEGLGSAPTAAAAAPGSGAQGAQQTAPSQASGVLPAACIASVRGGPGAAGGAPAVRILVETLGALLVAAEQMMSGAYPQAVPLPCGALQRLVARIVRFNDAAVLTAKRVPPSASGFAELQSCVPALHEAAWGMLSTTLRVAGSSMTPHHVATSRLLCEYLRRIWALGPGALGAMSPNVRAALFTATAAGVLAVGGGVGIARAVAGDALGAASVELYGWMPGAVAASAAAGRAGQQPQAKKAKREAQESSAAAAEAAAAGAAAAGPAGTVAVGGPSLGSQLAALRLLQVLSEVFAPLMSPAQRAQLDSSAFHVASCAWAAAQHAAREPFAVTPQAAAGLAALQAAAYKLLLASVLAPDSHRPPFLSQAVVLFSQGRGSACPHVAAVCASACAQLEGLLHPRSLPITGVLHGYPGHAELQPLPKPLMWSALDAARYGPTALPAALPAAAEAQAPAVPVATQGVPASRTSTAVATPAPAQPTASAAAAATAPLFGAGSGTRMFAGAAAAAPAPAAGAAPPAAPASQVQATVPASPAAAVAAKAAAPAHTASAPATQLPSGSAAAPPPVQAPVLRAAAPAPVVAKASSVLAADDSSDSEGSLPDIDSGSGAGSESSDSEASDE